MGKQTGGWLLMAIAAFMLLGFVATDAPWQGTASVVAFVLTVVAPAAGGIALISSARYTAPLSAGREALRKQVLEAEILRMAAERGNRITVIELVTELSLTAEMARGTLEDMLRRGLADIQVTDLGGIVYTFPDLDHLHDRSRSKGLLDA
jgi:predicted DNA-binding transcriptional regulator